MSNAIAILPAEQIETFNMIMPAVLEEYQRLIKGQSERNANLRLLSLEEISELWGFDKQTVSRYLKEYKVKSVKFTDGRSIRYPAKDVEALIARLLKAKK